MRHDIQMNIQSLESFADDSRIWIYGFNREFKPSDKVIMNSRLAEFVQGWTSHGEPVRGGFALIENIFVVLAVSSKDFVSGCSIDSSVAVLKEMRDQYGLDGLDRSRVYYRDHGQIVVVSRRDFVLLTNTGKINANVPVFDTTIPTLGDLRAGKFEIPLGQSWHAELAHSNPS